MLKEVCVLLYEELNLKTGDVLSASHIGHMERGIKTALEATSTLREIIYSGRVGDGSVMACDIKAGEVVVFQILDCVISANLLSGYVLKINNDDGLAFSYQPDTKNWSYPEGADGGRTLVVGKTLKWIAPTDIKALSFSEIYENEKEKGAMEANIQIYIGKSEIANQILGVYHTSANDIQSPTAPSIATLNNSTVSRDMRITQIEFYSLADGTVRFGIGYLDQRNWAIIESSFDKPVLQGKNVLDMSNDNIVIPKDRRLFVYNFSVGETVQLISWTSNKNDLQKKYEMIYGRVEGVLSRLPTEAGGCISLQYKLESVPESYATAREVKSIDETVAQHENKIATLERRQNVLTDSSGTYYRLVVVDGKVALEKLGYSNVLVISHSWGSHGAVQAYGFNETKGMCASVVENDYVHLLAKGIQVFRPNATVNVVNVASWERQANDDSYKGLLQGKLTNAVDLVPIRLGENFSGNDETWRSGLTNLINYIKELSPSADIVLCATGLGKKNLASICEELSSTLNVYYASAAFTDANKFPLKGDYIEGWGIDDNGEYNKEITALYPITQTVCTHPSDVGMEIVANSILNAVGLEPIDVIRKITLHGAATCPAKWVIGGVVSVHSSGANITARSESGQSIEVTNHGDGVFTFYMPNDNVVVTAL